ncbi:MAG TPA: IclR family transcriptional regulator C-terminal domain-containing protein [Ramlibacter sp.]|nr:IclR family transcriptional regulator C-terminal domain-containing protein [Ramlibacter sp.]
MSSMSSQAATRTSRAPAPAKARKALAAVKTPARPVDEPEFGATSALTRLLQILDLFSLERTTIRVDEVVQAFGIVQSTAYRYLKELCDAGLLAQQGKGIYSLGRRIVELERMLQLSDPLLLAGRPVLDSLEHESANRAFLLCAHYKDGALCVYKVGPDEIQFRGAPMKIQRGRGTLLPLFTGAGSQVILAHLPAHQIKSLYLANGREIAQAGLGESWKDFRDQLAQIRKQGYAETVGKMNPGMHSLATPVIRDDGKVVGSLLMLGAASDAEIAAGLEQVTMLQRLSAEIGRNVPAPEEGGRE